MIMTPADGKALQADLSLQLARACDKGFTLTPASSYQSISIAMRESARSAGCFYGVAITPELQYPNLVPRDQRRSEQSK